VLAPQEGRGTDRFCFFVQVALQEGIGEARKALRDKTFAPDWGEDGPEVLARTLAQANLRKATRDEVMAYFHNVWRLTDTLFDALKDDSVFYMKPDNLRRPLIFYFAHPATLYINKLHLVGVVGTSAPFLWVFPLCVRPVGAVVCVVPLIVYLVWLVSGGCVWAFLPNSAKLKLRVPADNVDPFLQKLFETGVDEMSWDDMDELQNDNFPWPSVAEAQDFRNRVRVNLAIRCPSAAVVGFHVFLMAPPCSARL
jgi:hypothetical protein